MVNERVVAIHAEEASFLWVQRNRAIRAPNFNLRYLQKADERCEAHVDGLRVAGAPGWKAIESVLDQGAGEVFAASVPAFESDDAERIEKVLEVARASSANCNAAIAALGWMDPQLALRRAGNFMVSADPFIRRIGLAAHAIRRIDPGAALREAILDPDPQLSDRALKAASELGRVDLLSTILSRLPLPRAALTACRLGDHAGDILRILTRTASSGDPLAGDCMDMALRCLPLTEADAFRASLSQHQSLLAIGILGDPAAVPELLAAMENPELARLAGASLTLLSGLDVAYENFEGTPPPLDDEEAPSDPYATYEFPSAAKVAAWWRRRAADFSPGVRYINGYPVGDEIALRRTLALGYQPQRTAAALELALAYPDTPLFETRARAQTQIEKVGPWIS
jgi:uncharacterized protein (TIGR02270 family)